jgi:endonuclease G
MQKVKKAFASALLLLIIFAIGASALFIPLPAKADLVQDALEKTGLPPLSDALTRLIRGQRAPQQDLKNPSTQASKANGDGCKAQLPLGITPQFNNPKLNEGLTRLCFTEYAVVFSAKTRTPLWSAEYLTKQRITAARHVTRQNTFHEEDGVPASARSRLSDYFRSGYDRGHMAPSGSASNPSSQNETFSLADIVPQEPITIATFGPASRSVAETMRSNTVH